MTVQVKEAAADAQDVAGALAVAAGIAGVAGFATGIGYGIAGILTIGSGVAWLIGNEYGDLAADPPRYDYHLVTKFSSRNVRLPPAENQRQGI